MVAVSDGKRAEEEYFANPKQFFLILLDYEMPIQNGLITAQKIRNHNPRVPIVDKDKEECLAAGANHYLTKPVTLSSLNAIAPFQ